MKTNQLYFVMFFSFLTFTACNDDNKVTKSTKSAVIPVSVQKVSKKTTTSEATLKYSGSLKARSHVTLSFLSSGKLQSIQAEVGESVANGQLLAQLDQTDYQSQVVIHKANFTLAQDAFNRIEKLYKKNSIPESNFIEAQAKLQQAKAQLQIAEKQLADTRLVAPFNATVSRRSVELGALVNPSVPAYELVELQRMYAVISVPESEIGQVKQGAQVALHILATQADLTGLVKIITPVADPTSRTFEVKIEVLNNGTLKQGMLFEAVFDQNEPAQSSVVVIPGNALLKSPTMGEHVFIVDDNKTAKAIAVEIADFSGQDVIVSKGLQGGEQLIVQGQHKVKNGSLLQI